MKKVALIFTIFIMAIHTPGVCDINLLDAMADVCKEQGKIFDGEKCIFMREIQIDEECTTNNCLLDSKNLDRANAQVIAEYKTANGRCLAGVKRLLTRVLGSEWMTNTKHAKDYLPVMRESGQFHEYQCDRERIAEYPNSAIFIFDARDDCGPNNMTPNGRKCSYSGHIMVKLSDTEEFAGQRQALTKWSNYWGPNCYTFILKDAVILDNDPDGEYNVCFLPTDSLQKTLTPITIPTTIQLPTMQ